MMMCLLTAMPCFGCLMVFTVIGPAGGHGRHGGGRYPCNRKKKRQACSGEEASLSGPDIPQSQRERHKPHGSLSSLVKERQLLTHS